MLHAFQEYALTNLQIRFPYKIEVQNIKNNQNKKPTQGLFRYIVFRVYRGSLWRKGKGRRPTPAPHWKIVGEVPYLETGATSRPLI